MLTPSSSPDPSHRDFLDTLSGLGRRDFIDLLPEFDFNEGKQGHKYPVRLAQIFLAIMHASVADNGECTELSLKDMKELSRAIGMHGTSHELFSGPIAFLIDAGLLERLYEGVYRATDTGLNIFEEFNARAQQKDRKDLRP